MAELLQRRWNLPVLRVTLDAAANPPLARFELAAHEDGQRETLGATSATLADLGFPRGEMAGDQRLAVPAGLAAWVAGFVQAGGPLQDIRALWVHLVKPYGHLGGVPWERALVPAVGRPVLRLPDVLPAPQTSRHTLEVALCASGAAAEGPSPAERHLEPVAHAIARAAAGRRVTLHVFADRQAGDVVRRVAAALPGVSVIDHVGRGWSARTRDALRPTRGALRAEGANPWLAAMRDALHGRGIDVAHFVCHGYHTGYGGALLFAGDPRGSRGDWPSMAPAADLDAFLTDLGAADVAFTAPEGNHSEAGLLELADRLGVDRPGTTVVHDAAVDPSGHDLEAAYALMLADGGVPPLASPALALLVQPRRVEPESPTEAHRAPARGADPALDIGPATKARYEDAAAVPGWLASAERFIDQQRAELARYQERAADLSTTPEEAAYYAGVARSLAQIRAIVDAHAAGAAAPPAPELEAGPGPEPAP